MPHACCAQQTCPICHFAKVVEASVACQLPADAQRAVVSAVNDGQQHHQEHQLYCCVLVCWKAHYGLANSQLQIGALAAGAGFALSGCYMCLCRTDWVSRPRLRYRLLSTLI
ncbi:TPA: hypothetical protein ACH3X1_013291 [Trebouxia sp. C0004]